MNQGQATHLVRMCQREISDRIQIRQCAMVVALGNAHLLLDRADGALLDYHEGLYLAEVDRNMTSEPLLRIRLAQLDVEDERLTEGIKLGKRALSIYRSHQLLVHGGR